MMRKIPKRLLTHGLKTVSANSVQPGEISLQQRRKLEDRPKKCPWTETIEKSYYDPETGEVKTVKVRAKEKNSLKTYAADYGVNRKRFLKGQLNKPCR